MRPNEMFTELPNVPDLSKIKKVLIVGPAYPFRGGLATYDERLCREFIALGYSCEILSFKLQYPTFLFPGKTQYSESPKPTDIIIHSKINSISPLNWIRTGLSFKKKKYDIVIFRYWMSFMAPSFGTIARILASNPKTRVISITDNIIPHEKRFFDKPFTSYFLGACSGFISMSKEVLGQLAQWQPAKPRQFVAHPMYDMFGPKRSKSEAKQALHLDPDYDYILFFGFIRKYKGLQLLLESFADQRLRNKKLKLIIAGEFYEDRKPYDALIEELQLEEHLIMRTDFIPNEEVGLYFSACDMVVQTYISATQSGVTQIAYFYEKPMLVTDVGGLAEHIPDRVAGYVCSTDKKVIADSIIDFYEHNREAAFEEGVRLEKHKFTWDFLVKQIVDLAE